MALKTDQEREELLNPAERRARELSEREQSEFDDIADNYDKTADDSQENDNIARARRQEENPASASNPMNYNPSERDQKGKGKASGKGGLLRRRGPLSVILILVFGGGLASIVPFANMIMPIDLTERLSIRNDSSTPAMERRAVRVLSNMMGDNGGVCGSTSLTMRCKLGRVSNYSLHQLSKKGVVPMDNYDGRRTGYPRNNPSGYTFTDADGRTRNVTAQNLRGFLAQPENRKWASQVLGKRGAFNLRVKAWAGKHLNTKLFSKFSVRKNGGIADGDNRRMPATERLRAARAKLVSSLPGGDRMAGLADNVRQKVRNQTGKVRRGGSAYLAVAAGCIAPKIPSIVAATVAAVHLKDVLPIAMNLVLSPGSKAKASGVDTDNSVTTEDMDTVGTLLTHKTPRERDGKMTSALDSPYLLAALGVNTGRLPTTNHVPGFGVLTSPLVRESRDIDESLEPSCNVILSPTTMWTFAAADAAVTAAASATILGGLLKIGISWAVSHAIVSGLSNVAGNMAMNYAQNAVDDLNIEEAAGEELGDIIGISAMSFFASGGMARHLPVLTEDQVSAFNDIRQETIAFNRDMELANVHPLDPSSQYTITGSILHNIHTAALKNGTYGTPLGLISGIASLPMTVMSNLTSVNALEDDAKCTYADRFGMDTGNSSTTPAIDAAGLPCTGINSTQATMDTDEALRLLGPEDEGGEGWINDENLDDLPDNATIQDLVDAEVIVHDTFMHEYIETCSNPETGDYLFNSAGCTIRDFSRGGLSSEATSHCDGDICFSDVAADIESGVEGVNNPRAMQAVPVFLLDYQMVQSINGEDIDDYSDTEGEVNQSEVVESDGNWARPNAPGFNRISQPFGNPVGYNSGHRINGRYVHNGTDLSGSRQSEPVFAACSGSTTTSTRGEYTTANTIVIDCGNGITVGYHHAVLTAGSTVRAGEEIGYTDLSGRTTGHHLHLTVKENGVFVDPVPFFRSRGVSLTG